MTKEQTNKILQEYLELDHITDPNELDAAIRTTLADLSPSERVALANKLGQNTNDLVEEYVKISRPLKIVISFGIPFVCHLLIFNWHLSIFWTIPLYLISFIFGVIFWIETYYFLKSKQRLNRN